MPDSYKNNKAFSDCLMVFSKLPVKGKVKTRLIGKLSAQEAKELYCLLLEGTLNQLDGLALQKTLWVKGEPKEEIRQSISFDKDWQLFSQQGSGLSETLSAAFRQMMKHYEKVLVIGGDCIAIQEAYINEALKQLDTNACVIGPALDGGFVLLGFRSSVLSGREKVFFESLYADIEWRATSVYQQLMENLRNLGVKSVSLEELWDIDRPEDLKFLKSYPEFQKFLS